MSNFEFNSFIYFLSFSSRIEAKLLLIKKRKQIRDMKTRRQNMSLNYKHLSVNFTQQTARAAKKQLHSVNTAAVMLQIRQKKSTSAQHSLI